MNVPFLGHLNKTLDGLYIQIAKKVDIDKPQVPPPSLHSLSSPAPGGKHC